MKDLFAGEMRDMTKEEANVLMSVMFAETRGALPPVKAPDLFADIEPPDVTKIIQKRLELTDLEYSPGVVLVLSEVAACNPGRAVMLAHALFKATREYGEPITVLAFGLNILPRGYPTDDNFRAVWNSQKIGSGNYLDTAEAWQ